MHKIALLSQVSMDITYCPGKLMMALHGSSTLVFSSQCHMVLQYLKNIKLTGIASLQTEWPYINNSISLGFATQEKKLFNMHFPALYS